MTSLKDFSGGARKQKKDGRHLIPSCYYTFFQRKRWQKTNDGQQDPYPYVPIGEIRNLPILDTDEILKKWLSGEIEVRASEW